MINIYKQKITTKLEIIIIFFEENNMIVNYLKGIKIIFL